MYKEPVTFWRRLVHRLNHLRSINRLTIGVLFAILMSFVFLSIRMELLTRIMLGWDLYCFCIMVLVGITWFTMGAAQMRIQARIQDNSRGVVFALVLTASLTSLAGVMVLLSHKAAWVLPRQAEACIYLTGVALSWFLVHIVFTQHYAHAYYGDHPCHPDKEAGGLQIPGDTPPNYLDFAYFSFVIGMTFQVSDIAITSQHIRKWVLLHGLLSFVFNTVIVALTINEVVSLQS
ncbi:DUF1345 domain-containing protein [Dinghuibacter silviterrae]|uniref:Putative membrane protein n=1 Tax=Dinghuibacter silviterrae TaxID=1539049 RepID=A0A4R8DVC7_9BACT|nr:DUF1345 domain-containing protein [Dinghuibacter silviterrae]TDX01966.1 putative membrane protein [Dinghuibacter silviterrae]